MSVFRIYVEKKADFAVEAKNLTNDINASLGLDIVARVANRYDVEGISKEIFDIARDTVFSEPNIDNVYYQLPQLNKDEHLFAIEYLPGQFDQRADSCAQCIQLLARCERPKVKNARVYIISGNITEEILQNIKKYLINPVESREASLAEFATLEENFTTKDSVETLNGFISLDKSGLEKFLQDYSLAMDIDDVVFMQEYFKNTEKREPTITEIRMIDTYWSDHCRHTTFSTNIDNIEIVDDYIKETYNDFIKSKELLCRSNKPITLMELATIGARKLKADGLLKDLDESEEINACSVKIKVDVNGNEEDWLLMFKNETHNHPTEIEPFGGAATCLGGAIRDPLSGRSYVYQAMRVTGGADPYDKNTLKGKLPQKKIITGAASGYSSYGNQIGLATGMVNELYHDGYR
ncbi:MAG: phosphoribosylformylglycinamidine synthase, partial [Oscillospiraceae bacterium]